MILISGIREQYFAGCLFLIFNVFKERMGRFFYEGVCFRFEIILMNVSNKLSKMCSTNFLKNI